MRDITHPTHSAARICIAWVQRGLGLDTAIRTLCLLRPPENKKGGEIPALSNLMFPNLFQLRCDIFGDVKIMRHILNIVVFVQKIDQFHQFLRGFQIHLGAGLGFPDQLGFG